MTESDNGTIEEQCTTKPLIANCGDYDLAHKTGNRPSTKLLWREGGFCECVLELLENSNGTAGIDCSGW